ncbi:MAG: hypothetical protein ACI381_06145 [Candidatus Methanomethylophilaceae archaeon]
MTEEEIIESISDMYIEMSELADEMHEMMGELKDICEERDLGLELKHIQFYVDAIRDALSDMEFPLMDLEQTLGGEEE